MKTLKANPIITLLTISTGFIVIYLLSGWKWAIYVSLGTGLIGILSPWLSKKIHYLWMKLAWLLNLIVSPLMLSLFFYLFLFPIALLSKIFGKKDPLMLKNTAESTYRKHEREFDKAGFERPW